MDPGTTTANEHGSVETLEICCDRFFGFKFLVHNTVLNVYAYCFVQLFFLMIKKMSGTLAQQHKDGLKFFFDNQLEAT